MRGVLAVAVIVVGVLASGRARALSALALLVVFACNGGQPGPRDLSSLRDGAVSVDAAVPLDGTEVEDLAPTRDWAIPPDHLVPPDRSITGDLVSPAGCMKPCTDSRDCGTGLKCVDLYWFYWGTCPSGRQQPICISTSCQAFRFECMSDLPLVDDYCQTDHVARVWFQEGHLSVNHLLGRELLYCPNGCVDSCSSGGCDGGARGTNARCR